MAEPRRAPGSSPFDALPGWRGAVLGVALVAATLGLRLAIGFASGDAPIGILFVLPVVVAARFGGRVGGYAATAAAGLVIKVFFLPELGTLRFATTKTVFHWVVTVAVCLIVTLLVEDLRRVYARARAERNLARENEARYRRFFENITEGAIILRVERDRQGLVAGAVVLDANPRAKADLGRELVGRRWADLGLTAANEHLPRLREICASPDSRITYTFEREGRHFWVTGFRLDVDEVVLTAVEVTEQRRLEQQFHQAQRLESVGRLAGGIAHDFNNIVTVVLSGAAALREDHAEGRPFDLSLVGEIEGAGERARDLTRQLLAFARRQLANPIALDISDVVLRSEKLLRRVLGEDVRLVVRTPGGEPAIVKADPVQLEQVLFNLAVNARDAMPRGGTLALEVERREHGIGDVTHVAGRWVVLVVRDDGTGMPPEVLSRAFEPFFTTKEPGKGTGLGLATVHGIVEASRGHVHLRSEPGEGTEFRICLPSIEEAVEEPAPEPAQAGPGTGALLVVEDDPQVRAVTVRTLARAGYSVQLATSGPEALAYLREHPSNPLDLLVTDVVMPVMSGTDLALEVVRQRPGVRVLFLSGYSPEFLAERHGLADEARLLQKPFTPEALLTRVRQALALPVA